MYSTGNRMPVSRAVFQSDNWAQRVLLVAFQHILPDTGQWIESGLEAGAAFSAVFAKPFSVDEKTWRKLEVCGVPLIRQGYDELEAGDMVDRVLMQANQEALATGRKLLCVDIGGYFGQALARLPREALSECLGCVEVTTFGHNRYGALVADLPVPVFSIARSPLKDSEGKMVGDSAVVASDLVIREAGSTMIGRNVGVIGFGMIAKRVARSLSRKGSNVRVYDHSHMAMLDAALEGFDVAERKALLASSDCLFSATGQRAVSLEDLRHAKDGISLISAGSKGNEFDVPGIREKALYSEKVSEHIERYVMPWGKTIHLVRNGTAVNFLINSCPDQVMDIVFAEVTACLKTLEAKPRETGRLHELCADLREELARSWLLQHRKAAFMPEEAAQEGLPEEEGLLENLRSAELCSLAS